LSRRTRVIVTSILLCLALGATIFLAAQTVQAIQRFQQTRALTAAGDVSTIRPWMTIPDVSRVYHVPESYLYVWLNITDPQSVHSTPLRSLAVRFHQSLDGLIKDIQAAIESYRKQHHSHRSFSNQHANEWLALERRET
jgi:hypothetical protein